MTDCNLSSQHKMVLFNNLFSNKGSIKELCIKVEMGDIEMKLWVGGGCMYVKMS